MSNHSFDYWFPLAQRDGFVIDFSQIDPLLKDIYSYTVCRVRSHSRSLKLPMTSIVTELNNGFHSFFSAIKEDWDPTENSIFKYHSFVRFSSSKGIFRLQHRTHRSSNGGQGSRVTLLNEHTSYVIADINYARGNFPSQEKITEIFDRIR
jgi:hypothetical protein